MVAMFFAYKGLEQDFLPLEDKSRMFCMVFTPNGSTSEFTDRQLQKALDERSPRLVRSSSTTRRRSAWIPMSR
jgi:multidrug efflux pump subunit AcrB